MPAERTRSRWIQHLTVVLMLSLSVSVAAHAQMQLPDLGSSADLAISEQQEREYAERLIRELNRLAEVMDDPLIDSYIKNLGFSIASFSDKPSSDYHFFVIQADSVNAFATPGGVIAVHSGLFLLADNESELAGVLAHEVAHVTQRHIARSVESAQKIELPLMLAMLGVALAGGGGDAIQAAVVGSQGLAQQMMINFTRSNEQEADRVGIRTLYRAGYDPDGMISFFEKMARISRNYGNGIPEFLRTHPVETSRIAEAKQRARSMSPQAIDTPPQDYFMLMKERLRVLTAERPEQVLRYYQGEIDQQTLSPHLWYGMTLAHLRLGEFKQVFDAMARLPEPLSSAIPSQILFAELEAASGEMPAAIQRFDQLLSLYPENLPISSSYATVLLQTGDQALAQRAEALLKPLLIDHPTQPSLLLLYSRAAKSAGDDVRAGEAMAEYTLQVGQVFDASRQLKELLKDDSLTYYQRTRIEAKLEQLEIKLARIEREKDYDPSEGNRPGRFDQVSAGR